MARAVQQVAAVHKALHSLHSFAPSVCDPTYVQQEQEQENIAEEQMLPACWRPGLVWEVSMANVQHGSGPSAADLLLAPPPRQMVSGYVLRCRRLTRRPSGPVVAAS
jgi:hypothetical protein